MRILGLLVICFVTLFAYTNALIYEESPYLRQHAYNPVNWLPWGKEAFEKAKREHKPIFLSIGYSTCHWCHVMERESFENEEIAKLINDNFIPIKVDKEERPDIDKYYQMVYAVMHNRSGGWPLTIIMSEDKKPFFAATYIPPEDGYGVKGLKTILPILAKAYKNEKDYLEKRGDAVLKLVNEALHARYVPVQIDFSIATKALKNIANSYDGSYGGFSKRVKFPEPSKLDLLFDLWLITKDKKALEMAQKTLTMMAKGGIFDQIDGGFFRYTTDRKWSIPHFEKMLYTNAELVALYTRAYFLTGDALFKSVVERTIKEMDRRFLHKGLYFSASDADTNGTEGGYFLFSYDGALKYLLKSGINEKRAKAALKALGITKDGNIDGDLSNPTLKGRVDPKILWLLSRYRQEKSSYPFVDKKIITAWNAMYIAAKLKASLIDNRYKDEALKSLDTLMKEMYNNGRLYHQKYLDNKPSQEALLEDYSYVIGALLEAYEACFDTKYLKLAQKLFKECKSRFYKDGIWYFSDKLSLPADLSDSYYTSALATLYHDMLTLALLFEDRKLFAFAKKSIYEKSALIYHYPERYPSATKAILRLLVGDVLVKSKDIAKRLTQIAKIKYPYIFVKKMEEQVFLACTMQSCFCETKSFAKLQEAIEKRLMPAKPAKWKPKEALSER